MLCFSVTPSIAVRCGIVSFRQFQFSAVLCKAEEKTEKLAVENDILREMREPEVSEEEILRKRFKARLPESVFRRFVAKEPQPLENKFDFRMIKLRRYYAEFGQDSKLNPGICWPTREEILETIKYDKIFEPPLQEKMAKVEYERLAEEERKRQVEAEVDANMANLDKWMKEYHGKIKQKEEKIVKLRADRERLVEEISEYLGYDIDPKDPRFKEAVEQREKEQKKSLKAKKQQESYDKMLEKLRKIAQNKT